MPDMNNDNDINNTNTNTNDQVRVKPKRVRPATERRRLQNRAAQQKYREKQRARVQELEKLAAVKDEHRGSKRVDDETTHDSLDSMLAAEGPAVPVNTTTTLARPGNAAVDIPTATAGATVDFPIADELGFDGDFDASFDAFPGPSDAFPDPYIAWYSNPSQSAEMLPKADSFQVDPQWVFPSQGDLPEYFGLEPLPKQQYMPPPHLQLDIQGDGPSPDFNNYVRREDGDFPVPIHPLNDMRTAAPFTYDVYEDGEHDYGRKSQPNSIARRDDQLYDTLASKNHIHSSTSTATANNGPDRLMTISIDDRYSIRDIFLAGLKTLGEAALDEAANPRSPSPSLSIPSAPSRTAPATLRPSSQPSTPQPLRPDNLTLTRTSSLRAYFNNSTAIGISIPRLCRDACPSPFCITGPDPVYPHPYASIKSFEHIPTNLRPVPAQVNVPHPAWIDLLPFPTLRGRIINLACETKPPLLEILELKTDVFLNEGLFCWHVGKTGDAQPWDMHSWEAAPWFLRKYWMLVGGEEGEVWKQTKWWRGFRGEAEVKMVGKGRRDWMSGGVRTLDQREMDDQVQRT